MAMTCVNGTKECNGCMACEEPKDIIFAYCSRCNFPIFEGEDFMEFDEYIFCEECLTMSRRTARGRRD